MPFLVRLLLWLLERLTYCRASTAAAADWAAETASDPSPSASRAATSVGRSVGLRLEAEGSSKKSSHSILNTALAERNGEPQDEPFIASAT